MEREKGRDSVIGMISPVLSIRRKKSRSSVLLRPGSTAEGEKDRGSMMSEGSPVLRRQKSKRNMSVSQVSWPVPMRAIGAQNLLTMPGGVTTSGYLHKKGGSQFSLLKWPLRYIIIHKGCVYYFKTSTSATPQGAFSLSGYNRVMRAAEETTSNNVFPFKVVHFSKRHRTWLFSAASEDERRKWMRHLRREIDHYNDRRDMCISSDQDDADDDAESFYGTIESPMEITHAAENPEADYVLDEDSDEDDYLKPDESPPPPTGRTIAPPPSYPPPPVPYHPHPNSQAALNKPPASTPPPIPRKPPPSCPVPTPAGLTPPGFAPPQVPTSPVPKPSCLRPGPRIPAPPIPSSHTKPPGTRTISTMPPCGEGRDGRPGGSVVVPHPATLPICRDLEKVILAGHPKPPHLPPPSRPPTVSPPTPSSLHRPPPPTCLPSQAAGFKPHRPAGPPSVNFLPPVAKPPMPVAKPPRVSMQSSPDGQSFRSPVDEMPSVVQRKKPRKNHHVDDEDSDDDGYENVHLPDTVFLDTVETSTVERMFKDWAGCPPDGLYGFRNSGTKTSKVLVVWDISLNKARNYRLFEELSKFFLETDYTFNSLAELVEYYHTHPLPNHGSLCLQKPYGYIPPR
ncbi:SH3 domain-binding protein 2 isoform X2 [Engraulis encrasicolus]|uniref:SH3 domain-binding protein 2 isoform X2 n=1 Tax=Engraulis encrasicolus TaxID=184585 RepID=UPI002FD1D7D6